MFDHSSSGADKSSDKPSQLTDFVEYQADAISSFDATKALYTEHRLSIAQIAEAIVCAKSTVQRKLKQEGVSPRTRRKHAADNEPNSYHVGQIPFGKKVVNGRIVDHVGEQRVIGLMKRRRAAGASFNAITEELNQKGIKSKNGKTWYHATVGRLCSSQNAVDRVER